MQLRLRVKLLENDAAPSAPAPTIHEKSQNLKNKTKGSIKVKLNKRWILMI
jgi:exoribonuclease II